MTDLQDAAMRRFRAHVAFRSDDMIFALERYVILAADACKAERDARDRAVISVYHNERIPDLVMDIEVLEEEPDDDPAGPFTGGVRPLCASCGSDDLFCHTMARWNAADQAWALSLTFDDYVCESCNRQGAAILRWQPVDPHPLVIGDQVFTGGEEQVDGEKRCEQAGVIMGFEELTMLVRHDDGSVHREPIARAFSIRTVEAPLT